MTRGRIALAHDYLTQRGGAERVALELARAFPEAPIYTLAYDPRSTYAEFGQYDIRVVPLLRSRFLTGLDVRALFPILPLAVRSLGTIDADLLIASSSGWAHGFHTTGRKVVYCHNPARWLYQPDAYFKSLPTVLRNAAAVGLRPWRSWDQRMAKSPDLYVANSENVSRRVQSFYGRTSVVVHPPRGLNPDGPVSVVPGIEPGFYLTVGRKRGYKRTGDIIEAFRGGSRRLVEVGGMSATTGQVTCLSGVTDNELRWLYQNCRALIAVADEDFGLTPVEAYAFGRPVVALASGGYLETSSPASTVLVGDASAESISRALDRVEAAEFDPAIIRKHAERWTPDVFATKFHGIARQYAEVESQDGAN